MKKIIIIIVLLLVAFPVFAENIYLSPAKFKPGESLLGNKNYKFSFYISNNTDSLVKFTATIDCRDKELGKCGNNDWFKVKPKGEFSLEAGKSQEIEVQLKVDKNAKNQSYENILVIYPQVPVVNGQTKMQAALGGLIQYTKEGKISKAAEIAYLLKDKIGTPLLAAISNAGLSPKTLAISSGVFIVGFIGINIFGKITKRFKKRKVVYPGEYRNNFNKNNFNKDW